VRGKNRDGPRDTDPQRLRSKPSRKTRIIEVTSTAHPFCNRSASQTDCSHRAAHDLRSNFSPTV